VEQVAVGSATVTYDEGQTNTQAIAQAIDDAGYQVLATR
jgi:copper chaperone CopZ